MTTQVSKWKSQHILLLLFLALGSPVIGYFLAYLLFSETLIRIFSAGGSEKWVRGILGDIIFQLCCGVPLPILVGFTIAIPAVLVDRVAKFSTTARFVLVGIFGFLSGFMSYFPWQFIMLLGSAF